MTRIRTSARISVLTAGLLLNAAPAQVAPVAVAVGAGTYDLWEAAEAGTAQKVLDDLVFLPLELVGHPPRDRLLIDRPRPGDASAPADHVLLPQGGALYRVRIGSVESLLQLTSDGHARLVASAAAPNQGPAHLKALAVADDGRTALLATRDAAGGNVLRVDLDADPPQVFDVTADVEPLDVEGPSLRVSAAGAFFVAAGELWRAPAGGAAAVVDLGLVGIPVQPDIALSGDGQRVAVVAGAGDPEEGDRQVLVADQGGAVVLVTSMPGPYGEAGYDHPLGPFLALDDTGSLVAYRTTTDPQELFVKEIDLPQPALQLTVEPQFPAYIDNVGVLGFHGYRTLVFFAGDVTISGVDLEEMMGAAELYRVTLPVGGAPEFTNVSLTSGQSAPPYDSAGQLRFSEAVFDPMGKRFLLPGESPAEEQTLTSVSLGYAAYGQATVELFDQLDEDPAFHHAGQSTLLVTSPAVQEDASNGGPLQLHLLPPAFASPESTLIEVATLPAGLTVDRVLASRDGTLLAFAVSAGPGLEIAVLTAVQDGVSLPVLFLPLGLAPQFAFTAQTAFVAGFGGPTGPFKFAIFPLAGAPVLPKVPVAAGFPLPH